MKLLCLLLLVTGCANTIGYSSENDKGSFSCEEGKVMCLSTKDTCVLINKEFKCSTSIEVDCLSRGDDRGPITWQSKETKVGNTKLILNCQVSQLTN